MKYLSTDFYESFQCIGGECPFTCCAGNWTIPIDKETKREYDCVDGEFGQILRENILSDDDSSFRFRLTEDGRCSFLTAENLCKIYQELGPEKLCYTCQIYPRIVFQCGDILFRTLTLSCPEVSRMLLDKTEPISFCFAETPSNEDDKLSIDWDWFNTLVSCFVFSVKLIQNRNYTLSARLRALLIFTFTMQTLLEENKDIAPLLEAFSNQDYLDEQLSSLEHLSSNVPAMFSAFLYFYQKTGAPIHHFILPSSENLMEEFINSNDKEELLTGIVESFHLLLSTTYDTQYEHFCVSFLFRNYFEAYTNKKSFEEVSKLVYALLIARGYAVSLCSKGKGISTENQISLFSRISRILEHGHKNLAIIQTYFEKNGQTDISFLLALV
ncbi:MAG: flagellin lysine-N-methylase [Lachnospiraceae bacterium]|nr:flagellin lysine-N-methylase [Lachnospiraceae bacterium]